MIDDKRKINVLFTGTYNSMNVGEMAMVLGAIKTVQAIFPSSTFSVLSCFPEEDRQRYANYPVKVIGKPDPINLIHRLLLGTKNTLLCLLYSLLHASEPAPLSSRDSYVNAFCDADIVLDLSGHSFRGANAEPNLFIIQSTLESLVLTKVQRKPFVLLAQTIEPPFQKKYLFIIRSIVFWADTITTREKSSFEYLKGFRTNGPVISAVDLGYLAQPMPSKRVDRFLCNVELPLIAVMPRKWALHYQLNAEEDKYGNIEFFRDLVDFITVSCNFNVLLIPHWFGPGALDDRSFVKKIFDNLKNKEHVIILNEQFTAGEILSTLEKCSMVISANLHPTILASSLGIPFIVISSSDKFNALPNGRREANPNYIDVRGKNYLTILKILKERIPGFIDNLAEERRLLLTVLPDYRQVSKKNGTAVQNLMRKRL